jgi:hypothetical protein
MNLIEQIKHYAASKIIVKEHVTAEQASERMSVCLNCEHRDPEENKCNVCTCFLDLKTGSRVNWRPSKNRNEITHCPIGKWNDKEIANEYRRMDGLQPLT